MYSRSFLPLKKVSGQIGVDLKFGSNDTIWDLGYYRITFGSVEVSREGSEAGNG